VDVNVLANDTDADGDALTVTGFSGASHGTVTDHGNGLFTYTPDAGYVGADSFTYTVSDGASEDSATVSFNVVPNPFQVTGFALNDSGFHLDFNRAFDATALNLYDAADAPRGQADLVLTMAGVTTPVRGSLVLDADYMGATFVRSNGVLGAGTYTLTLASRADGWKDATGELLDGNADGVAGGDYSHGFTVAASSSAVLSVGEITVGPGQALNVPAAGTGLPITVSNAAGLANARFDLVYDPAMLNLTGLSFGAGVSDNGSSIDASNGIVHVNVNCAGLGSGTAELVRLLGSVRSDVAYGAKQVLDLRDAVLDGGARTVRLDDGLQLAAFVADASGNGGYAALDQTRMQRVIGLLDSGFSAYPLVDPVVVADVNNSKSLTSADTLLLARELKYLSDTALYGAYDRPEIPPVTITPTVFAGADPLVNIPDEITALAGGFVTVPVMLAEIEAGLDSVPLESAILEIAWDASQLELVGVQRGSLTRDFDLFNASAGRDTLRIDMSRLAALDVVHGSLAELRFRVLATGGAVTIDLAHAELNDTRLTLNPAPIAGDDPTDGGILVGLSDDPRGNALHAASALAATPSPRVDFQGRFGGFGLGRASERSDGGAAWLDDWLVDRKNDKKTNLESLRIQPKVQPKLTSSLSGRL
ncbi:MAG: cadherin-like domain-containing protein, partial [Pseudomonadota bacterium]